jgi:hypothetical protein
MSYCGVLEVRSLEDALGANGPIKKAEMKLNMRYWLPPWFLERHQTYEFVAVVDPLDGKAYRWVHK